MTKEEQIDWLCRLRAELNNGVIFTPWNKEFTDALTGILDSEPCDCVSRQAVINHICEGKDCYKENCKGVLFNRCMDITWVNELPPAEPITKEERALLQKWRYSGGVSIEEFEEAMDVMSGSENPNKWIPLKTRPMTDEENTFYRDWAEYGAELFDCPLPDDGQEVLVSWGGNVCIDTFVKDDRDGCYFEGVDIGDVEAWQPLPEPYKEEEE